MRYFAFAVLICFLSLTAYAECTSTLFIIKKSSNKNVVYYDVNIAESGHLDADEPVRAYWRLLESDGRIEDLNFIEKKLAFGIKADEIEEGKHYVLSLKAAKDRQLRLKYQDGCPKVFTDIAGHEAVLSEIFARQDGDSALSKVLDITIIGHDAKSGKPLSETIKND